MSDVEFERAQNTANAASKLASEISYVCSKVEPATAALAISIVRWSHEKEAAGITAAADELVDMLVAQGALNATEGGQL